MKTTVSFLVSGRGSNFTAVAKKIQDGSIKQAKLGIVISDNADAKALEIAQDFGMQSYHVDPKAFTSKEDRDQKMLRLLQEHNTDLVVAAGFMRILTPIFIKKFKNRIINIHPALLPSFPGVDSQEQAFNHGVKITGCTAHFIDEGTDTGPIILQAAVPIEPSDTVASLSARILKEEHLILPEAVRLFCEGKLTVVGRKVVIK